MESCSATEVYTISGNFSQTVVILLSIKVTLSSSVCHSQCVRAEILQICVLASSEEETVVYYLRENGRGEQILRHLVISGEHPPTPGVLFIYGNVHHMAGGGDSLR